ncbi:MAG: hypothetical protein DMG76_14400 [Acidobacteria bacterium]|nr:MAG: hypothetical protein DMG76_14400 [Acidobacteriota bacterium]
MLERNPERGLRLRGIQRDTLVADASFWVATRGSARVAKFFADSREPWRYIQGRIIQFDDLSLPALGFAKSIAKDQGATLHLLHVVAMASALGEPAINATLHSRAEEKAIEALNDIAAKHLAATVFRNCIPRGIKG